MQSESNKRHEQDLTKLDELQRFIDTDPTSIKVIKLQLKQKEREVERKDELVLSLNR